MKGRRKPLFALSPTAMHPAYSGQAPVSSRVSPASVATCSPTSPPPSPALQSPSPWRYLNLHHCGWSCSVAWPAPLSDAARQARSHRNRVPRHRAPKGGAARRPLAADSGSVSANPSPNHTSRLSNSQAQEASSGRNALAEKSHSHGRGSDHRRNPVARFRELRACHAAQMAPTFLPSYSRPREYRNAAPSRYD